MDELDLGNSLRCGRKRINLGGQQGSRYRASRRLRTSVVVALSSLDMFGGYDWFPATSSILVYAATARVYQWIHTIAAPYLLL